MRKETDVDGVVLVGLFGSMVTMATSLVVGVIWFSWFIVTKKNTYRCGYCKDVFENPEYVPLLTNEELHNTIIKRKTY
ncbi:hypothetical protein [Mucilaginibacter conchicola]|nr:hypothetical protein [Mucilaginibacter conchicola]